jgi:hypothetical protein
MFHVEQSELGTRLAEGGLLFDSAAVLRPATVCVRNVPRGTLHTSIRAQLFGVSFDDACLAAFGAPN